MRWPALLPAHVLVSGEWSPTCTLHGGKSCKKVENHWSRYWTCSCFYYSSKPGHTSVSVMERIAYKNCYSMYSNIAIDSGTILIPWYQKNHNFLLEFVYRETLFLTVVVGRVVVVVGRRVVVVVGGRYSCAGVVLRVVVVVMRVVCNNRIIFIKPPSPTHFSNNNFLPLLAVA